MNNTSFSEVIYRIKLFKTLFKSTKVFHLVCLMFACTSHPSCFLKIIFGINAVARTFWFINNQSNCSWFVICCNLLYSFMCNRNVYNRYSSEEGMSSLCPWEHNSSSVGITAFQALLFCKLFFGISWLKCVLFVSFSRLFFLVLAICISFYQRGSLTSQKCYHGSREQFYDFKWDI